MNIFKLRPLALGCCVGLLSLYLSYFLGNIFSVIIIVLALSFLGAFIVLNIYENRELFTKILIFLIPICVCLVVTSVSAMCCFGRDKSNFDEYKDATKDVELVITDIRYSKSYETLAIAKIRGEKDNFKLILSAPDDKIEVGDIVTARATFRELTESTLGYNEKEYYLEKGIYLHAECEEYNVISKGTFVFGAFLERINSYLVSAVEKSVNSDTASLVSAMLLGNRDAIDDSVSRDFARLGISHILALSGIHLSLVTGLVGGALDVASVGKKSKYVILLFAICAMICITGFSESAIRAGLMLIIMYTMDIFGHDSDGITSLFVSVLLICVVAPYSIFSTSLILSFVAMLACLCTSKLTRKVKFLYKIKPKLLRGVVYTMITSIAVTLFTLPVMAIKFDHVSIFAPIFNIIFVPILTVFLYLSVLVLILGNIPFVSVVVTYPAELIVKATIYMSSRISRLDFLTASFTSVLHMIGIVVIFASLVALIVSNKKCIKYCLYGTLAGVAVFALAILASFVMRENRVSISTHSYVATDIVAVESENEVMILECSSPNYRTTTQGGAYASYLGYSDIERYVIADYSHTIVTAVDSLTDKYMIREITLPEPKTGKEKEYFALVEEIASSKNILVSKIDKSIDFGETCVDFMEYQILPRSTKRCVAFSVLARNGRFTYLGASSYECISYFPKNYVSASDVVLFGAYGPNYKEGYKYDLSRVDYVAFSGSSKDFLRSELSSSKEMPIDNRFIFK